MNGLSLYGVTQEIEALEQLLTIDQGEISEEYEQLEEEVKAAIVLKTDSCLGYLKSTEDQIKSAKEYVKDLQSAIKAKENKVNRFKEYIMDCLEQVGGELQGERHTMKFRKPSQILTITDEKKVPAKFTTVETTVKISKAEIKAALKNGEEVAGVKLEDGARSLNIKMGGK